MSWIAAKDIFPPFDAVSAQELLMSVIIMHPKHNLEMKYKSGEGGESLLFLGSCCEAECEIPDHDVMKMYFLQENIHFTLSRK